MLGQRFLQPYYVMRPRFVAHRVLRRRQEQDRETVGLPWGLAIVVRPSESVGRSISRNGIFDLAVSEALMRLVEPGDLAVDVGANIGYMTSVMAHSAGSSGRVLSLEAHPHVYGELRENVERWTTRAGVADVDARCLAVSGRPGKVVLATNETFERNRGGATIVGDRAQKSNELHIEVEAARLDELIEDESRIGVLKIDVEGHEEEALRGAAGLLSSGRIRDVIFEDHNPYPTPSTQLLEDSGYTVFGLGRTFFGPAVGEPGQVPVADSSPSFLASVQPDRVRRLMSARGWRALGSRPGH